MSVAGIATTAFSALSQVHRNHQSIQGKFKPLGQDLSSGNLTQAQTDFGTLSQSVANRQLAASPALSRALNTLGQALQSGDLSAAQAAYSTMPPIPIPATVKEQFEAGHPTQPGGASSSTANANNSLSQVLSQLGQALQTGNLSLARQAFSSMQQGWSSVLGSAAKTTLVPPTSSGVNLTA